MSGERWQVARRHERAFWNSLEWQKVSRERRISEWDRHLRSLDLSLEWFRGRRVLDVGCGPTGAIYFLDAEQRVGLDPLANDYQRWNGYWGDPIELVASPGEAMPFDTGSFDAVVCVNAMDHTRDPGQVIREIVRVLTPGGTLLLHTELDSPLRKLHKRIRREAGWLHPHALSYDWLYHQLEPVFAIQKERRDPETFRACWRQIRYEAFWDGLIYQLTGSRRWINHIWLRAERRP